MRFVGAAAVALALATGLLGCGGSKAQPATSADKAPTVRDSRSPAPSDELPSNSELHDFFAAIAARNVTQLAQARRLAEPGSLADAYMGYQISLNNAYVDAGLILTSLELSETHDGYKSCGTDDTGRHCFVYASIRGRSGKIVAFTINGTPLRITGGTDKYVRVPGIGRFKFLYAYQSVSDDRLTVVVDLQSATQPIVFNPSGTSYRDTTGRQMQVSDWYGPNDQLAPHSRANLAMVFGPAAPGGVVHLDLATASYSLEKATDIRTH